MNKVFIIGRITSDLATTQTQTGLSICKFSVAYNEKFNNVEKAHFFNCTAFKQTADFIVARCKKGGRIAIDGKLIQNTWENKEGQKRSSVEINVFSVKPIDWADQQTEVQSQQKTQNEPQENPFSDDDIPF